MSKPLQIIDTEEELFKYMDPLNPGEDISQEGLVFVKLLKVRQLHVLDNEEYCTTFCVGSLEI